MRGEESACEVRKCAWVVRINMKMLISMNSCSHGVGGGGGNQGITMQNFIDHRCHSGDGEEEGDPTVKEKGGGMEGGELIMRL